MPRIETIICDGDACDVNISDAAIAVNTDLRRFTLAFDIARGHGDASVEHNDQGTHYFCSTDHLKAFVDTILW